MPEGQVAVQFCYFVINLNDGCSGSRYLIYVRENLSRYLTQHFVGISNDFFLTFCVLVQVTFIHVSDIHKYIQVAVLKATTHFFLC